MPITGKRGAGEDDKRAQNPETGRAKKRLRICRVPARLPVSFGFSFNVCFGAHCELISTMAPVPKTHAAHERKSTVSFDHLVGAIWEATETLPIVWPPLC